MLGMWHSRASPKFSQSTQLIRKRRRLCQTWERNRSRQSRALQLLLQPQLTPQSMNTVSLSEVQTTIVPSGQSISILRLRRLALAPQRRMPSASTESRFYPLDLFHPSISMVSICVIQWSLCYMMGWQRSCGRVTPLWIRAGLSETLCLV